MMVESVLELLNDDILSCGLFNQVVTGLGKCDDLRQPTAEALLVELLSSGQVEVGSAKMASPEHVEFIAWKGSVDERVHRAMEAVRISKSADKEFAHWLCLSKNIDRYEESIP